MRHKLLSIIGLVLILLFAGCGGNNEKAPSDPNELLAFLEAKIKQNPKDAELYYERGRVLLDLGQVNDAINSLNQAVSLKSGVEKYHLLLADAYFRNGQTTESYSNLQAVLGINPKNTEAYLKMGEIALFSRDYERSRHNIEQALELDDMNAQAYFMQGYLNLETGDTTAAVRSLRKTIEIDNEYSQAYELLGLLFINRNDPLGVEYLTTVTTLDPNNTVALYALALHYQNNEDVEKAQSFYNKLLSINPQHTNALHNMGYIELLMKGEVEKAIEYFDQAIQVDPSNIEAHTNRAYAYELSGDKAKARKGYEDALAIDKNFKPAVDGLQRVSK